MSSAPRSRWPASRASPGRSSRPWPCGRVRAPSGAARPRSSAPLSPSACSAFRGRSTMEFALSDEQRALQDAVRSYLRDRFGPTQVRAVYDDPSGDGDPAELWKAIGEQGWLAVLVPEEYDGMGLGLLDASIIARAFGAGTVPTPWLATVLAAEAVRLAGSPDQQKSWLPRLASGEIRGAVAIHRPGSSPIPANAPATATNGKLGGKLDLVEYAGVADVLVVAAQDGLYLVDPKGSGVTLTQCEALDRTTRLFTVELEGAAGE